MNIGSSLLDIGYSISKLIQPYPPRPGQARRKSRRRVMGQLRSGEDGEVRADESVRTKRFGLLL